MQLNEIDKEICEIQKKSVYARIIFLNQLIDFYEKSLKEITEKINRREIKEEKENIIRDNMEEEFIETDIPDIFDDLPMDNSQLNISVEEIKETKRMKIEDRTIDMKENYITEKRIVERKCTIQIPKEINRLINEYRRMEVVRNETSVLPENNFDVDEPHSMESFHELGGEIALPDDSEYDFNAIVENVSKEERAVLFFNLLISLNKGEVNVKQDSAYGNIRCEKNFI